MVVEKGLVVMGSPPPWNFMLLILSGWKGSRSRKTVALRALSREKNFLRGGFETQQKIFPSRSFESRIILADNNVEPFGLIQDLLWYGCILTRHFQD
jgi:hypothetical protein